MHILQSGGQCARCAKMTILPAPKKAVVFISLSKNNDVILGFWLAWNATACSIIQHFSSLLSDQLLIFVRLCPLSEKRKLLWLDDTWIISCWQLWHSLFWEVDNCKNIYKVLLYLQKKKKKSTFFLCFCFNFIDIWWLHERPQKGKLKKLG